MVMKAIHRLVGLCAILAMAFLFLYSLVSNEVYERAPLAWERPVYKDGWWMVEGIVEHGVETRTFPWGQADLVMARYGKGALWALAGLTDAEGNFFSRVDGVGNREDLLEAFRQPRWVAFSILETDQGMTLSSCESPGDAICQVISSAEKGNPALMAGDEGQSLSSQSSVFIQTGEFPGHYQFGILTWRVKLGEIIEQGLEGF
jgi:hypothetical protein